MKTCERCGKDLVDGSFVWLELSTGTGLCHEPGTVPASDSQGLFAFGIDCARKVRGAGGKNEQIRKRAR